MARRHARRPIHRCHERAGNTHPGGPPRRLVPGSPSHLAGLPRHARRRGPGNRTFGPGAGAGVARRGRRDGGGARHGVHQGADGARGGAAGRTRHRRRGGTHTPPPPAADPDDAPAVAGDSRTPATEPIAVLWASESSIYPRFGYGLAAQRLQLAVPHRDVSLPGPAPGGDGRLRQVDPAGAQQEFAEVYEALRAERPGWSGRDERWWRFVLADPPSRRDGRGQLRAVVHETSHGVTGYALWRHQGGWAPTGPDGSVEVREAVAADPQAYAAIWRFLLSIDLTRTTNYSFAALDEPLLHLVPEPCRLGGRLIESLWVRLIDLPRALAPAGTPHPSTSSSTSPTPADRQRGALAAHRRTGAVPPAPHGCPGRPRLRRARAGIGVPRRGVAGRPRRRGPGPGADPRRARDRRRWRSAGTGCRPPRRCSDRGRCRRFGSMGESERRRRRLRSAQPAPGAGAHEGLPANHG